jgi:hypothetical protein
MSPDPIEVERFRPYLERRDCPGMVVHLPHGAESFFVAMAVPIPPFLYSYGIYLPYSWSDSRRIREVAIYIARIELRIWQRSNLDRIIHPLETQREDLTAFEIADRLIAPQPWVEDMIWQFGTRRRALEQAARSISIPLSSVHTVLRANRTPVADAIHRHVRELTGYPWFLPAQLRDTYPTDRW